MDQLSTTEGKKMSHLINKLWVVFCQMGTASRKFKEFDELSGCLREAAKALFTKTYIQGSLSGLQLALATARNWTEFCDEAGGHPWEPSSLLVRLWLAERSEKGATTANSSLQGLKWLQDNFAVELHARDPALTRQVKVQCHEVTPATPLGLRLFVHWEVLTRSENLFVKWIAWIWCALAYGVMRFAHLQRSSFKMQGLGLGLGLVFHCVLGKSRKDGQRSPFWWIMPSVGIQTETNLQQVWVQELLPVLPELMQHQRPYLIPAFGPQRVDVDGLRGLRAEPMSINSFTKFSRQLLQAAPANLSPDKADEVSSYSARRVIPTMTELGGFPDPERLAAGGWAGKEAREYATSVAMPNRYAASKLTSSLLAKLKALRCTGNVLRRNPTALEWDWERIVLKWPNQALITEQLKEDMDLCAQRDQELIEGQRQDIQAMPMAAEEQAEAEESGSLKDQPPPQPSSSSSSSSLSTHTSDQEAEDGLQNLQWALPKTGKLHLCKPIILSSSQVAVSCGKTLQRPELQAGLAAAAETNRPWSPRCWARLS